MEMDQTKDSATFVRSEIAKARIAQQTSMNVEHYIQISWHL